jgi:hypothetical protein
VLNRYVADVEDAVEVSRVKVDAGPPATEEALMVLGQLNVTPEGRLDT